MSKRQEAPVNAHEITGNDLLFSATNETKTYVMPIKCISSGTTTYAIKLPEAK